MGVIFEFVGSACNLTRGLMRLNCFAAVSRLLDGVNLGTILLKMSSYMDA